MRRSWLLCFDHTTIFSHPVLDFITRLQWYKEGIHRLQIHVELIIINFLNLISKILLPYYFIILDPSKSFGWNISCILSTGISQAFQYKTVNRFLKWKMYDKSFIPLLIYLTSRCDFRIRRWHSTFNLDS